MRRLAVLAVVAFLVVGCGGSTGRRPTSQPFVGHPETPRPTPKATPQQTPRPSADLISPEARITDVVYVGDVVEVEVRIRNRGKARGQVEMTVSGPSGMATLLDCKPTCSLYGEALGVQWLGFADIRGGVNRWYKLRYQAIEPGRIEWLITVKDVHVWGGSTVVLLH